MDDDISPLVLNMSQIYQLVQIILMELSSAMHGKETDEHSHNINTLMERRLSLLLSVSKNTRHLQKAINMSKKLKK